jgi:hypothetical protein
MLGQARKGVAQSMTNIIEQMPDELRGIFVEVLQARDSSLLAALRSQDKPTSKQGDVVESILADELVGEFGAEWEPSVRGKLIERAVEEFRHLWPSD